MLLPASKRSSGGGRGALPGFTALETYADTAIEDYRGDGTLRRVGSAMQWRPRALDPERMLTGDVSRSLGASVPTLAWHDRTLVVLSVEGPTRLVLNYYAEADDRLRARELARRMTPFTRRYVDWRLYAGNNSEVVEGETRLTRYGKGWRAVIKLPAAISGVLFAKVLDRLGPIRTVHDRDDSQLSRLEKWESVRPGLVLRAPRLGQGHLAAPVTGVFVHGTRSCGVPALEELKPYLAFPFVRYEHDTFRSVVENAMELSDLVRGNITCERLVLVGHSRGGLVSRLAAAYLRQSGTPSAESGTPSAVDVWTFGTPHRGTPIVGRGLELAGLGPLALRRKLRCWIASTLSPTNTETPSRIP